MSEPSAIPDTGTAPQCPARLLEDVFFAPLREVMDGSPAMGAPGSSGKMVRADRGTEAG